MSYTVLSTKTETEAPETGVERKAQIANALTGILADTYLLTVKTHGYHWNVVGPLFQPIHELTEKHYNDLFQATDVIAERIRALGQIAPVSFTDMISHAEIVEEDVSKTAFEMVEQLIADHETLVRRLRDLADRAASHRDGVTEDLANVRMGFHEEAIWMLRAMIAQ